jgi:hypothetical protein
MATKLKNNTQAMVVHTLQKHVTVPGAEEQYTRNMPIKQEFTVI